jgi:dTDP-4-amino-4,6-dideoxygalactose transaminase
MIPLSDIDFGPEEEEAVLRVLRSKWLSMGEETQAFEREFADYLDVKHAIAVANGTAALHLALLALGIGPGDAVIQPAVNFVAAANMTLTIGATPVFADVCSLSEPTISPNSIMHFLKTHLASHDNELTRPKAVVVMHYGGYSCQMDEILNICREHNLVLIEDACHAIGASPSRESSITNRKKINSIADTQPTFHDSRFTIHNSRPLGSIGDIGCFSFFSNKNLVTGEGGMVTTNSDDLAESIRNLRSHGMTSLTWDRHKGHAATYDVTCNGFNYRIDEIRSALGRAQLKKLDHNNARRRNLTALYWEKLAPLEDLGWTLPFRVLYSSSLTDDSRFTIHGSRPLGHSSWPSCHLLPLIAPNAKSRWSMAETLKAAGIQTSLHYPFIPAFTAFSSGVEFCEAPLSQQFCSRVMTIPLFPTITEAQLDLVTESLLLAARRHAPRT